MTVCYRPGDVVNLSILWHGDVAVVGGGSAGCAAAVAAARRGASTLLIEAAGFLGGTGAAVLDTAYGFYAPGAPDVRVVGGIGWELASRLLDRGQAFERPNTYGAGTGVTYEPEALKLAWDELTAEAGVAVLLHATVTAVVRDGSRLIGLVVQTKAGPGLVAARTIVDASGDAEVAWRAGAAVTRPADERVQPMTATFRLGGVDVEKLSTTELHERLRKAADTYNLPRLDGSVHRTLLPGVVHTNLTRVTADPTDPWQLSAAEAEGRRQVAEYVRFLVNEVPGYENAYLIQSSVRIGVRESRRLRGRYLLTREDVLEARDFPDAIARCGAPLEDHAGGETTIWAYVGGEATGATYGVPYRCLLPVELDNLVVAGRCLSATHDAHASVRSIAQCLALGQAAGTAAALAPDGAVARQDPAQLRDELRTDGAII
ncbi:MAG TPA: FAD-dependent oxidoreductase [Natronosporangium sp.]